ncbi:MAG: RhuM family protein [Pirellulales bacterium]
MDHAAGHGGPVSNDVSEHNPARRGDLRRGKLSEPATCKDFLQVRSEEARQVEQSLKHYNLDVIISIGYRVRSHRGTQFRIWATERLREYLIKGFAMDDARLKRPEGGNYFKELLARRAVAGQTTTEPAGRHANTQRVSQ